MKRTVYVLEEYVGKFTRDCVCANFIGVYKTKKQALKAKAEHLLDIDPECTDGYQLTKLTVRRKGFEYVYLTEDLGK